MKRVACFYSAYASEIHLMYPRISYSLNKVKLEGNEISYKGVTSDNQKKRQKQTFAQNI